MRIGGLAELRFAHRILRPGEVAEAMTYLPDHDHVPFADNGCGDLCCWQRTEVGEPRVFFADHEIGHTDTGESTNFTDWLREHKR